ncbi:Aste57867_18313 [Aphanomyces stellatus]|uniref:Aste57867_18313 protein n=1 Tax=Aphanomyces stellatus TaxID=120398 RepID=A0A485LAD1_9STRA|nr:hypothetical protein As57867_018251 [Aphanomyces stellatus]VFT95049.1 Aste57867_18313 [Aphanomyces stellatus]
MAAATAVLTSPALVFLITAFQHGLTVDLFPFRALPSSPDHSTVAQYARLDRLFRPWYDDDDGGVAALRHWFESSLTSTKLDHLVVHAVVYGRTDTLMYMHHHHRAALSRVARGPLHLVDLAAWSGQITNLMFLHDHVHHLRCTTFAMDAAAAKGHLAIVQFLHTNRREGCSVEAMDLAATYGHLDVVQFLHTHRTEGCTTQAMDNAAWRGHLDVVEYLHTHRTEGCTAQAMQKAAANGQAHVVEYLHIHRTEGCLRRALLVYPPMAVRDRVSSLLQTDGGCRCAACVRRDGRVDGRVDDALSWFWQLCTCGGFD